ncbi:hypothetical protein [Saccharopolyspora sp. 5N708]|uniref:hypothetical protein n=1 Tax=Saccharopolyspora sp. 5N708 TaxID=3457424 RepID=UPI003FCFEEA7
MTVEVSGRTATVRAAPDPARWPVTCACGSRTVQLWPGETARFSLEPHRSGA